MASDSSPESGDFAEPCGFRRTGIAQRVSNAALVVPVMHNARLAVTRNVIV